MNSISVIEEDPRTAGELNEGEVHVWVITLGGAEINPPDLFERVLSEDERERALRFRPGDSRNRFITARGYMRIILGSYLNIPPGDVAFEYSEHGKPAIASESGQKEISFNLSHSRNLALCAVSAKGEVGIDVEYIRPILRPEKILERFFSPGEREYFRSRPETMRSKAFMSLWTIKEAYSKAVGTGFSSNLKNLDFSPVLGHKLPSRASIILEGSNEKWSMLQFVPGNGYLAALAFKGGPPEISYFSTVRALTDDKIVP